MTGTNNTNETDSINVRLRNNLMSHKKDSVWYKKSKSRSVEMLSNPYFLGALEEFRQVIEKALAGKKQSPLDEAKYFMAVYYLTHKFVITFADLEMCINAYFLDKGIDEYLGNVVFMSSKLKGVYPDNNPEKSYDSHLLSYGNAISFNDDATQQEVIDFVRHNWDIITNGIQSGSKKRGNFDHIQFNKVMLMKSVGKSNLEITEELGIEARQVSRYIKRAKGNDVTAAIFESENSYIVKTEPECCVMIVSKNRTHN